jgi:hypothetical protein
MKKVFIIAATFAQLVVNGMKPNAHGVLIASNNITDEQFSDRKDIVVVKFKVNSRVTRIGKSAFNNCSALKSIYIPNTVTELGYFCFQNCISLESVVLKKNSRITSIGKSAFDNCLALKAIYIPNTVTELGDFCFQNCINLESVVFEKNSQITSIGEYAFSNCLALKSICIPNTVTELGEYCFLNCINLESVAFEKNSQITCIGHSVFEYCRALKSICIPKSVKKLGLDVVDDISIREIYHRGLTFCNCTSLESVSFEENSSLEHIYHYAFFNCRALKSICIPKSVETISDFCFCNCTTLESVIFEKGSNLKHIYIGGSAFDGCSALKTPTFRQVTVPVTATATVLQIIKKPQVTYRYIPQTLLKTFL